MRVVIAPDKFKGTVTAEQAAAAIAEGWLAVRPDDVHLYPMADGGDGTAAVLAAALADSVWVEVDAVDAAGRARRSRYLRCGDLAVVELALVCGLSTVADLPQPDPLNASTRGLGLVLRAALASGVNRVIVALGGSASTDGGAGAVAELPPAPGEVQVDVLVDVDSPLLGPSGAARTFAPQKGATPAQVEVLEERLRAWAEHRGGNPDEAGAGAAGGTGFGLASWGARLVPGAPTVASLIGLPGAVARADVVITGEGRFDETSLRGKVCGCVLELPGSARRFVIAGSADTAVSDRAEVVELERVAGSVTRAKRLAAPMLTEAAQEIARSLAD